MNAPTRYRQWSLLFVLVGLGLRLLHFARGPSVWHDEAVLMLNAIGKDYGEIFGPLFHHEAAPPLFLAIEHFMAQNIGDGIWSLRFPCFAISCSTLVLFWDWCRRTLPVRSQPWAVMLFAVSDRLLWHACEAKPYSFDVFVAVLAVWGFARTHKWPSIRRCLVAMPVLPACIWLSYPACFVSGGVLVALLVTIFQKREGNRAYAAWLGLAVPIGISFVLLATGPVAAQRDGDMDSCWTNHFPDYARPHMLPVWSFFSTTDMIRYCLIPFGQLLTIITVVGAVQTWRRDERAGLALLLVPFVLVFVAAGLHKYPFGGSRLEVFLAPAVIWLIARAVPESWDRLKRQKPPLHYFLAILLLAPAGQAAYRAAVDWPRADCAGAAEYVLAHREPGEALVINHWEYEYYFRHAEVKPVYVGEYVPASGVVWFIITGDSEEERESALQKLLAGCGEIERVQFFRSTVVKARKR